MDSKITAEEESKRLKRQAIEAPIKLMSLLLGEEACANFSKKGLATFLSFDMLNVGV